jgi:hypothetical protein
LNKILISKIKHRQRATQVIFHNVDLLLNSYLKSKLFGKAYTAQLAGRDFMAKDLNKGSESG